MPSFIVCSRSLSRHGLILAAKLRGGGFPCQYAIAERVAEGADADLIEQAEVVIVILDRDDRFSSLVAGYCAGAGKAIIFVAQSPRDVPPLIAKNPVVLLRDDSYAETVLAKMRSLLSKSAPPREAEKGPLGFLRWLSEDPGRLSRLSSDQFEELVRILLTGLNLHSPGDREGADRNNFIVQYKKASAAYLRCHHSPFSEKLSFHEVRDTSEAALNSGSDFALLMTTNPLTSAAIGYAYHCYPSVRILDQEAIAEAIKVRLEARVAGRRLLTGWLKDNLEECQPSPAASFETPTHHRIAKYGVDSVFVAAMAEESVELNSLIGSLEKSGAKVWHNLRNTESGNWCRGLDQIATAVRQSGMVVVFVGRKKGALPSEDQEIRTVALELFKETLKKRVLVLGYDDLWNRLRLPRAFDACSYVDVRESDWIPRVLRIWSDKNE